MVDYPFFSMNQTPIILASSSPFRRELLSRLHLSFECISPDIDETPMENEDPTRYVTRLAEQKAAVIAQAHPNAIVIGSDQCAYLDGAILGKPGNHQNALKQLQNSRGKEVVFFTGLSVEQLSTQTRLSDCIEFRVGFRELDDDQLDHYLATEKPYGCAGSFKSEAYGISLFSHMSGDDPTALIGLPLIRLVSMLEEVGIKVI